MKRLAFIVVSIAVLVGIIFGGISMAATSAPAAAAKPTPTPDPITQKLDEIKSMIIALQSDVTDIKNELRPGREKFETDLITVQLAAATFFADKHAGWKDINGDDNQTDATTFSDNVWGRTDTDTVLDHYCPTAIARVESHVLTLSTTQFDSMHPGNALVLGSGGLAATDVEIQAHAIWMGLLVNEDGSGTTYAGSQDRGGVSPLIGETHLYLSQIPDSAMAGNSYNGCSGCCGHYCWVVGAGGLVFGAYKSTDGNWYSGFNCSYP